MILFISYFADAVQPFVDAIHAGYTEQPRVRQDYEKSGRSFKYKY